MSLNTKQLAKSDVVALRAQMEHREPHTDWYYKPRKLESVALYRKLGVRIVEKTVMIIAKRRLFGYDANSNHYSIGKPVSAEKLVKFERTTRSNERTHFFGLLLATTATIFGVVKFDEMKNAAGGHIIPWILVTILASQMVIHEALIILQRYNRLRIYDVFRKLEQKLEND
ncbi:MAG: hypothetical protein Q7S22_00790 [Candidatus Micrarchaeota archaeon]|nr:hypothetical protein [Candidatus Micrarchaeota archaeon]